MVIQKPLESEIEFADNPDPRAPCILLLDVSGSMAGEPIDELNAGLKAFRAAIEKDVLARRRVEPLVVTFGSDVQVLSSFTTADNFVVPHLTANGVTNMSAAILKSLELLEERKREYKEAGIVYYRPWILLISDGEPTDVDHFPTARRALLAAQKEKKVTTVLIGVQDANMDVLKSLCGGLAPVKLHGLRFEELFRWLSASMARVSQSKTGENIQIENPLWGEVVA
jgi:uncharacterized protein YegL